MLKKADLDPEESKVNLLEQIQKAEVELRIANGKKFKEDYLRTLGEIKFAETEKEHVMPIGEFSFAFRKVDDKDADPAMKPDDEKKMQIIKKLAEKDKNKETPNSQ